MAGDPECLPLLVGLGLDEVSLTVPELPAAKRAVAELDAGECAELVDRACACASAADVRALLRAFHPRASELPLCAPELIVLDSDAESRAEVIQELGDLVVSSFRCDHPLALERAVWEREETYSTALGGGFAVPHCKSDAVSATTLAVVRPARPVDWEASDGGPVHCAILLAVRGSGDAAEREHMRTLAKLARRIVDDTFKNEILAAPDAATLHSFLSRELELDASPR